MSSEDQEALDAVTSEFVSEIKDDLANLETDLLSMEEKGGGVDNGLINHAFRAIHSIKGGAGFLNFKELSALSHVMESVLMRIKEKKLSLAPDIIDALLGGFDKMKHMVNTMGSDAVTDFSEQLAALNGVLAKPSSAVKEPPEETADDWESLSIAGGGSGVKQREFLLRKSKVDAALESQKYLYAVYLKFQKDVIAKNRKINAILEDIKSIGDLLFSDHDEQEEDDGFYCVLATILDPPLLVQVLEIDKGQLALLDKQFTDCRAILKGFENLPGLSEARGEIEQKEQKEDKKEKPAEPVSHRPAEKMPDLPGNGAVFSDQTIRINVDLISKLMNRAGELVLSRNQLRPIMEEISARDSHAYHVMQQLDMVSSDIQEAIMQMRMQPIINLIGKYKRVVRDIARRISKQIDFIVDGANVEVDRNILEQLANPMTHLIRNCIDHGIEPPEIRKKKGKSETGTIRVKASHQGGHVHIIISDDGAGIDPQLILSKAFEKNLVTEDEVNTLSDKQKINLIFLPGFSTSERITDISGRGVGMDVVKTNIEKLRGQIEITSQKGQGTDIHLIIPLTLAIVPSLIVSTGTAKFAIPQINVKEVIHLESGKIHKLVESIGGCEVFRLRDQLLPILRLRNVLGIETVAIDLKTGEKIPERRKALADRRQKEVELKTDENRLEKKDRRKSAWDEAYVIILKMGSDIFGLCVESLHDIEEVVVEPLSGYLKHLKWFCGATILGDGNVIMVLDVAGIAAASSLQFETLQKNLFGGEAKDKEDPDQGSAQKSFIVCECGRNEYFAISLEDISRIEPVETGRIHRTGEYQYIEYQQSSAMLFFLHEFLPGREWDENDQERHALFLKGLSANVALLVSRIVDTMDLAVPGQKDLTCPETLLGKVFIDDMMVQMLDYSRLSVLVEQKISTAKQRAGTGQ